MLCNSLIKILKTLLPFHSTKNAVHKIPRLRTHSSQTSGGSDTKTLSDFRNLKVITSKKGQGLIEYLIIVAIVAVGSIAIIRTVGANLNYQFANIAEGLGATRTGNARKPRITDAMVSKRDMGSFLEGAVNDSDHKSK